MTDDIFHKTQRMVGKGSKVTVIEPSKYEQFFHEINADQTLDRNFRAYLAVAVSGGCRVSEALELKTGSIDARGEFQVRVLKKRTVLPVYRTCQLNPIAHEIVQEYIQEFDKKPDDVLFDMHRMTVHRKIKKHFGPDACSHSIARHSHISWLLHNQDLSPSKVGVEMSMLTHVIDYYNHANLAVEQKERFKNWQK